MTNLPAKSLIISYSTLYKILLIGKISLPKATNLLINATKTKVIEDFITEQDENLRGEPIK